MDKLKIERILAFLFIVLLIGCVKKTTATLNEQSAAELSAELANEECKKLYGEQPFLPEHYKAAFSDGRWHWGYIDVAGVRGYSTEVSFKENGTDKKVEVQFHVIEDRRQKTSVPQQKRRTIKTQ